MKGIVSNGELVGVCDKPRFVMKNPKSGAYIQTTEENAEGIAVRGTLFNINGKEIIPDAPMAIIREMDGFEMLFDNSKETGQQKTQIDQNRADIDFISAMTDIDLGK